MAARMKSGFLALVLFGIVAMPGCLGGPEPLGPFPDFAAEADDGVNYTKAGMAGEGFIALFSAEWCNTPCHSVMHQIYNVTDGKATVLVMSTDPENDKTLEEWHQDANDYDDVGNDTGVDLPYPFMKNPEGAIALDVTSRPVIYFVDANGDILAVNEGAFDDEQTLIDAWNLIK